jgi:hypothetical protein
MTRNTHILKLLLKLPPAIKYEGYDFALQVWNEGVNNYVGYRLTGIHSNKKDKKEAFKMGFWHTKKVTIDSVHSDYFRKVLIFCNNDKELFWSLETLYNSLISDNIIVPVETDYTDISIKKVDIGKIPMLYPLLMY